VVNWRATRFRKPKGGRARPISITTRPHLTGYALRTPERLVRQAATFGPSVHSFAVRLLEGPLP